MADQTDQTINAIAESLSDSLTMLGVNPDETPEHGGDTTAQTLARAALSAIPTDGQVQSCAMTHTPPYDFATCTTHDTTFALGEVCKFHGKTMVDALQDEADEQRGLKVRAEMDLQEVRLLLGAFLTEYADVLPTDWATALGGHALDDVPHEHTATILEANLATGEGSPDTGRDVPTARDHEIAHLVATGIDHKRRANALDDAMRELAHDHAALQWRAAGYAQTLEAIRTYTDAKDFSTIAGEVAILGVVDILDADRTAQQ